jgi:hypothetical protein
MEDKTSIITLQHINPIGDVSEHQMCGDCYKMLRINCCPFCRCNIIIPKQSNTHPISSSYNSALANYNILRMIEGIGGWEFLN